ncbi:peptidase M23 [Methylophaga sp. 42_8_T64]|nr:peptidase M23 [Methylophaga sp. 41_12_T18]OUR88192.1 peptidase M23 [Methylophaga sp. 42_8_T64]
MQVIIISPNNKTHKHWHLSRTKLMLLMSIVVSLLLMSSVAVIQVLNPSESSTLPPFSHATLAPELITIPVPDLTSDAVSNVYVKKLGQLQAEAIRLKALTEKLASLSGLDVSSFLLDDDAAQGGIEKTGHVLSFEDFNDGLKVLSLGFEQQQQQLLTLQDLVLTQDNIESAIPQGKPIEGGWVSSYYGNRIDPFTGKQAFHRGIDIAGKSGTAVNTVADGIVTWIGQRSGYGGLVEVDHGNGYVTRYAHNKTIKVTWGDKVVKGQLLALMGSTGRSTGPHVHFEILRDGKHINPYTFVKR